MTKPDQLLLPIEKNKPIPARPSNKPKCTDRLTLEALEIGESFTVAQYPNKNRTPKIQSLMTTVSNATGKKFIRRNVGSEAGKTLYQIWRTE